MAMTRKNRDLAAAIGFLLPNFLGFFLFVAFPVLFSVLLVVTNWSLKPAIETEFVGLRNVWHLIGFRPIAEATPSGGLLWIVAFIGAYGLCGAGMMLSLSALTRRWGGTRSGGWVGIAAGVGLIVLSLTTGIGVGAGLLGVTMLFGYFFLTTSEDDVAFGPGLIGPCVFLAGLAGVYTLWGPVLARWEPLDVNFYYYLFNTLYLMVAIPINIAGSLALALILSEPLIRTRARNRVGLVAGFLGIGTVGAFWLWWTHRPDFAVLWGTFWCIAALGIGGGVVAFRTLFYIPTFTAGIAVMLLWKNIFNPTFGPLNEGLRVVFSIVGYDGDTLRWLTEITWAKPALMLMGFWTVVGGQNMLLYLAGLAGVPQELYEAASIDGANKVQTFWNVTWPQLAPTTFFIVIMSTIAGLQGGFEQARVMTNGGPAGSTKTLAYYVYEKAFEELDLGYASAIAWVLFLIVFLLTALNWRFGNRYVNY